MTIFAIMICFTTKDICYLESHSGVPATFASADSCERGRAATEALKNPHGNPAWTFTCVQKDVPTWQPVR